MELTPAEIERRRENANSLVAQGRLGGAEFGRLGGRPRKKRAAELMAEKVSDDASLMYERLKEIFETGKDANAIASIKTLLQIEENERAIQENEELRFEQLKRDDLIKYIAGTIGELQSQGIIPGTITDAEFEPVEYTPIEGYGSSDSIAEETS